MASLGILTLHGMGKTDPGYHINLMAEIDRRLGPQKAQQVKHAAVYYQDILHNNQKRYFDGVKDDLRWNGLRDFMIHGFGDAASLEAQKGWEGSPYFQAQQKILDALKLLYIQLQGDNRRVIVIAQSLGGQVISNYLWDAGRDPGKASAGVWKQTPSFDSQDEEDFCRGKRIVRLITTGCNIPLFVAGIDEDKIEPIKKHWDQFQWHNYYDKDDILGWPLRGLNSAYADLVDDHAINVGFFTSFTPFSHTHYWDDRSFLRPLIAHIEQNLP
ncbi:MAG: hypothetical protein AAGA69_12605 [Pseudomonadota bacterium]